MQVTNFLVDPLLPRRTSAQVFIRTVVPRASTTPVSDDRLVGAPLTFRSLARLCSFCALLTRLLSIFKFNSLIFNPVPNSSYEVLETRICSIRGWKTEG
ncbi:hypothetical protein EVAR_66092_1 [Eumeta japonica]|uniref:Uncharacterized protein n=1 Tax=Eumeta variegata TaxID=151549 RepID=A0A4C1ZVL4_EUMVA|nr:hypothetical protein EVAR_66092_1 [Eumeta japonica]